MFECGNLKKCVHNLNRLQGRHALARQRVAGIDAWEIKRQAMVETLDHNLAQLHAHYDQLGSSVPLPTSARKSYVTVQGEVVSIRAKS